VDTPAGKVVRLPFPQLPPRLRHVPMHTLAEMRLESDLERHIMNLQEVRSPTPTPPPLALCSVCVGEECAGVWLGGKGVGDKAVSARAGHCLHTPARSLWDWGACVCAASSMASPSLAPFCPSPLPSPLPPPPSPSPSFDHGCSDNTFLPPPPPHAHTHAPPPRGALQENRRLREGLRDKPEVLQAAVLSSRRRAPRLLSGDAPVFSLQDDDGEEAEVSGASASGGSSGAGAGVGQGTGAGACAPARPFSLLSPPARPAGSGGTQDALRTPLLSDDGCGTWRGPGKGEYGDGDGDGDGFDEEGELELGLGVEVSGRNVAAFSYRRGMSVDLGASERRRRKTLQRQQESKSCCTIS
jgi:hypothetical protein